MRTQRQPPRLRITGVVLQDEPLFERFRTGGDIAALGELFDRVAPALLRIALHLATGRRETNRFTIGPDDPPDRAIPIKLP